VFPAIATEVRTALSADLAFVVTMPPGLVRDIEATEAGEERSAADAGLKAALEATSPALPGVTDHHAEPASATTGAASASAKAGPGGDTAARDLGMQHIVNLMLGSARECLSETCARGSGLLGAVAAVAGQS
jgi:hypothetical protein